MKKSRPVIRRRAKAEKPLKVVIYLSAEENNLVEQAVAASGRSKSAFGAELLLKEAKLILGKPSR